MDKTLIFLFFLLLLPPGLIQCLCINSKDTKKTNDSSDLGGNLEQPPQPLALMWKKGSLSLAAVPLTNSSILKSGALAYFVRILILVLQAEDQSITTKGQKRDLGFPIYDVSLKLSPVRLADTTHKNRKILPRWLWPESVLFSLFCLLLLIVWHMCPFQIPSHWRLRLQHKNLGRRRHLSITIGKPMGHNS